MHPNIYCPFQHVLPYSPNTINKFSTRMRDRKNIHEKTKSDNQPTRLTGWRDTRKECKWRKLILVSWQYSPVKIEFFSKPFLTLTSVSHDHLFYSSNNSLSCLPWLLWKLFPDSLFTGHNTTFYFDQNLTCTRSVSLDLRFTSFVSLSVFTNMQDNNLHANAEKSCCFQPSYYFFFYIMHQLLPIKKIKSRLTHLINTLFSILTFQIIQFPSPRYLKQTLMLY